MPLLSYLLDTNTVSERFRGIEPVRDWIQAHRDEVAISTLTLAEMRRGIETKPEGKARRQLERDFRFVLEDFAGAVWVFDESAALEWGKLMAEARKRNHPLPFGDSLISAIARSMSAKVVSADKTGFVGCTRVDPWTNVEYAAW